MGSQSASQSEPPGFTSPFPPFPTPPPLHTRTHLLIDPLPPVPGRRRRRGVPVLGPHEPHGLVQGADDELGGRVVELPLPLLTVRLLPELWVGLVRKGGGGERRKGLAELWWVYVCVVGRSWWWWGGGRLLLEAVLGFCVCGGWVVMVGVGGWGVRGEPANLS